MAPNDKHSQCMNDEDKTVEVDDYAFSDDSDTIINGETMYTPSVSSGQGQPDDLCLDMENAGESDHLLKTVPPLPQHPDYYTPLNKIGGTKIETKGVPRSATVSDGPLHVGNELDNHPCRNLRRGGCVEGSQKRLNIKRAIFWALKLLFLAWASFHLWFLIFGHGDRSDIDDQNYCGNPCSGYPGLGTSKSRQQIIKETHRSVNGKYYLEDLLSVTTASGSIAITVCPQPADPDNPLEPARISLKAESGSISVSFATPYRTNCKPYDNIATIHKELEDEARHGNSCDNPSQKDEIEGYNHEKQNCNDNESDYNFPSRPYEIEIETKSGSVNAKVGFTSRVQISTRSGSINAHLVPLVFHSSDAAYDHGNDAVSIETKTLSGSSSITVTEPLVINAVEAESHSHKDEPIAHDYYNDDHVRQDLDENQKIVKRSRHGSHRAEARAYHASDGSGSLSISYPKSWAGKLHAANRQRGKINVGGQGLDIIKQRDTVVDAVKPPTTHNNDIKWWGSQGNMEVGLAARSGSIEFRVRGGS